MKEAYMTLENIDEVARKWMEELSFFRERHKVDFRPESSALIVIDMQRYFTDVRSHAYIPSSPAIIPRVKELMKLYLELGLPVVLTRHVDAMDRESTMIKWWGRALKEEDEFSEICPELRLPGTIIIRKHQYDAFYETELESILKEKGITQVVISGVMTHLCCETTARSAFARDFECFFPIDGTATYSRDFHRGALLNLSHGFAIPLLCEEMRRWLEGYRDGKG